MGDQSIPPFYPIRFFVKCAGRQACVLFSTFTSHICFSRSSCVLSAFCLLYKHKKHADCLKTTFLHKKILSLLLISKNYCTFATVFEIRYSNTALTQH